MRRLGQVSIVALLAAVVVVLAVAVHNKVDSAGFVHEVNAGKLPAAPTLNLPGLFGGRVNLAAYRGRPVVVNFWASWCAPCEDEAPVMAQAAASDKPLGVQFVGVDVADTIDAGRAFVARYGLSYPHARATTDYTTEWGVTGQPETFVLDRSGRAVAWYAGPVDPNWLSQAIQKAS
jgi:cytochrome c biogenesis protein CcmG, thiol:disulfide interchange protein DsbE